MLSWKAALLTDIAGYASYTAVEDAVLVDGVCGVADFLWRGLAGRCAFGEERLDVAACVTYTPC